MGLLRTFVSFLPMRVVFAAATIGVVAAYGGPVSETVVDNTSYCENSCAQTMGCTESYCKDNGVCFGLYHTEDAKCFQPDSVYNADCDDSVLKPVLCHEYPDTTCQEVCDGMDDCKDSSWGSYCKFWQDAPVCFGIIIKEDGSLCHASSDPECSGEPYPCQVVTVGPTEDPDVTTPNVTTPSNDTDIITTEYITSEVINTTAAEITTVPDVTTGVDITTAPNVTTSPVEDIIGKWCGDSSSLGHFEMVFDTTYVSMYMAGQYFYSEYSVSESEIVLVNPDDNLTTFLREMNSQMITEYHAYEMYVEFVEVTTIVAVKCY